MRLQEGHLLLQGGHVILETFAKLLCLPLRLCGGCTCAGIKGFVSSRQLEAAG